MLNLVLVNSSFEFQIFSNCKNAVFALSVRALTPSSDPPCLPMMRVRYIKASNSYSASSPNVILLALCVLYFRILLFFLCMVKPTAAGAVTTLSDFIWNGCCV